MHKKNQRLGKVLENIRKDMAVDPVGMAVALPRNTLSAGLLCKKNLKPLQLHSQKPVAREDGKINKVDGRIADKFRPVAVVVQMRYASSALPLPPP